MNALPVYATDGGRRFHAVTNCRALYSGQELYGGWGTLRVHVVRETTIPDAMGRGKEACTACFPGLRAAWYRGDSENNFGHEPMDVITNGKLRAVECYRCRIPWPCTSAIVLGLAPRLLPV